jgi:hypothetical protein
MRHSDKPIPPAITHNDVLAQAILVELRGLRDDLADRKAPAVLVELREPAAPAAPAEARPLDALAGPFKSKKKAGA